jgi:hypothetical protein
LNVPISSCFHEGTKFAPFPQRASSTANSKLLNYQLPTAELPTANWELGTANCQLGTANC